MVAIGGIGQSGGRWKISVEKRCANRGGRQVFFVEEPEGDRVDVVIATGRGRRCLKTVADDGDPPNNLLSQDDCP
jgi:hypothetical protein